MPTITWRPGETVQIPYQRNPAGSIAGWNLEIRVRKRNYNNEQPLRVLTIGHGIDTIDTVNGTFIATLSSPISYQLGSGEFLLEFWKNNEGDVRLIDTQAVTIPLY